MPSMVGGDYPDPINTETEYAGKVPTTNSVTDVGPEGRKLSTSERLRLGYLTGQQDDPDAPAETGFMKGVDSRFPETDLAENIPAEYRSGDYLS